MNGNRTNAGCGTIFRSTDNLRFYSQDGRKYMADRVGG